MKHIILLLAAACMPIAAHAQTTDDQSERAADPSDKQICKRFLETGSLVRGYRICKSKREWEIARDNLRGQYTASASCRAAAEGGSC